jgi:pyruvate/2-oxoglutarate/acetoin dehydrogenase E1 component
LLVALASVPAFGQPTGGLEEIIVTAEFRAANVQDTPVPHAPQLEDAFMPMPDDIARAIRETVGY